MFLHHFSLLQLLFGVVGDRQRHSRVNFIYVHALEAVVVAVATPGCDSDGQQVGVAGGWFGVFLHHFSPLRLLFGVVGDQRRHERVKYIYAQALEAVVVVVETPGCDSDGQRFGVFFRSFSLSQLLDHVGVAKKRCYHLENPRFQVPSPVAMLALRT